MHYRENRSKLEALDVFAKKIAEEKNEIIRNKMQQELDESFNNAISEFKSNTSFLYILLRIAKENKNWPIVIEILKTILTLKPKKEAKINPQIAVSLIKMYIEDENQYKPAEIDARLIEAKELLTECHKVKPQDSYIIFWLTKIADLEGDLNTQINLIRLQLEINPNDEKMRSYLLKLEEKSMLFTETKISPSLGNIFPTLYEDLMAAIDDKNKELTIFILNQITTDFLINEHLRRKIESLIDLAKSNKSKSQITLRGEVIKLVLKK